MKKLLFTLLAGGALFLGSASNLSAQDYKTGAGLAVDFGDGATLAGPHIKHFFNANGAVNAELLFGNSVTYIQGMYQHHGQIKDAGGLKWYAGVGPSIALYKGGSSFYLMPMAGLDLKIPSAPLSASFDWRPRLYLGDSAGSNFTAGRFGLGFRYTF